MHMDEAIAQKPLKYLAQVELVLEKIPTKELYKLQVNVVQEVQSHARTDATELQETRNGKDSLELVVKQLKIETKEEKQCRDNLETKLKEVFTRILGSAQASLRNVEEHIQIIVQTLKDCKKEIEELNKKLTSTTPLEFLAKREQEAAL